MTLLAYCPDPQFSLSPYCYLSPFYQPPKIIQLSQMPLGTEPSFFFFFFPWDVFASPESWINYPPRSQEHRNTTLTAPLCSLLGSISFIQSIVPRYKRLHVLRASSNLHLSQTWASGWVLKSHPFFPRLCSHYVPQSHWVWGCLSMGADDFPRYIALFPPLRQGEPLHLNLSTVAAPERLVLEVLWKRDRNIKVPKFWQHNSPPEALTPSPEVQD